MTLLTKDALKLLKEKEYFQEGESSWEDLCLRVSKGIAKAEENEEKRLEVEKEIYSAMTNLDFLFSTPVLLNADEKNGGQLSSCFIIPTKDNIEDICKTDAEFAKIFQKNGGAGTDLSVLRPAKSTVGNSKGYAGGILTFMEKYDATADQMTRYNPSRKGALKINLQIWHPEIFDFIHAKDDTNKLNRMNISVSLTDEFMNYVLEDKDWDLIFPDYENYKEIYDKEWDGNIETWKQKKYPIKIYNTIKAKSLFKEIAESAYRTGDPGLNLQDTMNKGNKNKHISLQLYTNPCNEFCNIPYSSCNLGSINLLNCVKNNEFDFVKLNDIIYKAVRWMDNMITINQLPLKQLDKVTKDIRPIGIGIMGLADTLFALKLRYNSKEGLEFSEKIIAEVSRVALQSSCDLAKERGEYPKWKGSEWEKLDIKIRNSSLLSVAPNGSLGFIANVNGGLEPVYALCYNRRTYDGNIYYIVNETFKKELEKLGIYSEELMEKISKNNGSCQGIKEVPKELQEIFVTASDITPKDHVDMVSVIQKYVDLSISKTVNFNKNATIKDIEDVFIYAWENNLKGLTVYRDGCRENQTLSTSSTYTVKEEQEEIQSFDYIDPPTKDDIGETYGSNIKRKVACGKLYINLCKDEDGNFVETFINTGKGGICQSNINALGRLISLAMRGGIKIESISNQLTNIKCPACTVAKSNRPNEDICASCPDAIGKYIFEKYSKGTTIIKEQKPKVPKVKSSHKTSKPVCSNCGSEMRSEQGCMICDNCGNSKCS